MCNFCTLEEMKRRAAINGNYTVELRSTPQNVPGHPFYCPKAVDVYFVPVYGGDESWQAWFAEVSEQCACSAMPTSLSCQ